MKRHTQSITAGAHPEPAMETASERLFAIIILPVFLNFDLLKRVTE